MAVPIWKDYFCNLGSVASSYFRIRVNSTTIYQGRAFRAASSGNLYIRINDICADYMAQTPPPVPNTSPSPVTFPISFQVQKSSNGSSWSTVETVDFNDDWSYDTSFNPSTMGMAFPITGRIDLRQKFVQTRYASGSVTATAKYGTTNRSITLSLQTSTDGTAFGNSLAHAGAGRVEFDCPTYETYNSKTLTSVTIGGVAYDVVKTCPQICLYYKNPFGGIDHLVIEGTAKRRRASSRETFTANYDNTAQRREDWVFEAENTETWTLHTGRLTDEQSARMPYLLESTDVFFCDLNNPTVFVPALIVTDSYDIQTFKSNGRTMTDYGFDVRLAQKQYRR